MTASRRLVWIGFVFLGVTALRIVVFPIIEPADPEQPDFWPTVSNYSLMLWVPAAVCFGLAALLWLRKIATRWIERP